MRARTSIVLIPTDTAELAVALAGDISGDLGDTKDLRLRVDHVVVSDAFTIDHIDSLGSSEVDITRELTDDHDIDAFDDLALEGRSIQQLRQDLGRSEVGEEAHFLTHLQETRLWTKLTRIVVPLVASDAGQEDRVGRQTLLERGIRERIVCFVDGSSTDQGLLEFQREAASITESLESLLGSGRDLWTDSITREKRDRVRVLLRDSTERRSRSEGSLERRERRRQGKEGKKSEHHRGGEQPMDLQ